MLKILSILMLCILPCSYSQAQNSGSLWTGQILNDETHEPISFVHIVGAERAAISDAEGQFTIPIQIGDTIQFSHINYERHAVVIWVSSPRQIKIFMSRKENLLPEIVIRDYLPLDELKQEIARREVKHSFEEANAINNIEYSTLLFRYGYTPEMNSLDNFKNYISEPQGVTLFSSNPSRGLVRSLNRLKNQKNIYNRGQLKLNEVGKDTLWIKRFATPKK